jgi:DNA-directed RNA polymerase subunit RPC12/RpoP
MYQRTYILFFGIAILFVGLFATLGGIVMIAELTNEIRRTVGYARERIVVKHEGVVVHDSTVTKPILKLPHHDFTIAFQGLTPQIFHDPVTKKSWAQCNKCGHKIYFTPQTVMHKNFPVTAPTLTLPDKCEECGNTIRTIEE